MLSDLPWRVAVLTTGRQDYGILRSTLLELKDDARFSLLVYAGGMHLSERFGRTINFIEADGLSIACELPFVSEPPDEVRDSSRALQLVGDQLRADAPDALLVLGDRSETAAAALAAALARVPLVHVHGGEETEGAIDNLFRHAITKLAQLHLVGHETYADRVRQMGEVPSRVVVVGAPGLDHLFRNDLSKIADLEKRLGRPILRPLILVTVHPTTLADSKDPLFEARAVADAIEPIGGTVVISAPNADNGGDVIRTFWDDWATKHSQAVLVAALGDRDYWGLMRVADVMVGNSSSGMIEAPAAGLSVVNVGDRQRGRLRSAGVVDVPPNLMSIRLAIQSALDSTHSRRTEMESRLFAVGPASRRILDALSVWLPQRGLRKPFQYSGA